MALSLERSLRDAQKGVSAAEGAGPAADLVHSWFDSEMFSAIGNRPVLALDARDTPPGLSQAVILGIDRQGDLTCSNPAHFDLLLTAADDAPSPWISIPRHKLRDHVEALVGAVRRHPLAATTLCRLLRLTVSASFDDALMVESLAYSTLLGGREFGLWLAGRPKRASAPSTAHLVGLERTDNDNLTITLNSPENGNAMTAAMRDQLFEVLCAALDDPSVPRVTIRAEGRWFSTGGALDEFGTAPDAATAHAIRTVRNAARLIHALGDRARIEIQGPAIGSGIEIAAAAARRHATANSWFQLPELSMGLLPGAGGTVTLPRAIGRHRTAWLALSGKRLRAREALAIGLIHTIDAP